MLQWNSSRVSSVTSNIFNATHHNPRPQETASIWVCNASVDVHPDRLIIFFNEYLFQKLAWNFASLDEGIRYYESVWSVRSEPAFPKPFFFWTVGLHEDKTLSWNFNLYTTPECLSKQTDWLLASQVLVQAYIPWLFHIIPLGLLVEDLFVWKTSQEDWWHLGRWPRTDENY